MRRRRGRGEPRPHSALPGTEGASRGQEGPRGGLGPRAPPKLKRELEGVTALDEQRTAVAPFPLGASTSPPTLAPARAEHHGPREAPRQEACSDLCGEERCLPGLRRIPGVHAPFIQPLHQPAPATAPGRQGLGGGGGGPDGTTERERAPGQESLVTEALASEGSPGPGSLRPGRGRVGPARNTCPSQISGMASRAPGPRPAPAPRAGTFALR